MIHSSRSNSVVRTLLGLVAIMTQTGCLSLQHLTPETVLADATYPIDVIVRGKGVFYGGATVDAYITPDSSDEIALRLSTKVGDNDGFYFRQEKTGTFAGDCVEEYTAWYHVKATHFPFFPFNYDYFETEPIRTIVNRPVTGVSTSLPMEIREGRSYSIESSVFSDFCQLSNVEVIWTPSNESIFTVESSGQLTAVSAGTANLIVEANGFTAVEQISVLPPFGSPGCISDGYYVRVDSQNSTHTTFVAQECGTTSDGDCCKTGPGGCNDGLSCQQHSRPSDWPWPTLRQIRDIIDVDTLHNCTCVIPN